MNDTDEIFARAKQLPPVERARLLDLLFSTFDRASDASVDQAWAEEAEDRLAAYRRGEISAASAEDVFGRINRKESSG